MVSDLISAGAYISLSDDRDSGSRLRCMIEEGVITLSRTFLLINYAKYHFGTFSTMTKANSAAS